MKTWTVTYFEYEPGDRLRNTATGKIYKFIKYNNGVCDTACVENDKGSIDTWGRKIIDNKQYFELAVNYSQIDPNHVCPADDCCSRLERDVQWEKKQKIRLEEDEIELRGDRPDGYVSRKAMKKDQWLNGKVCQKHKRYKAIRKPKDCEVCWKIFRDKKVVDKKK